MVSYGTFKRKIKTYVGIEEDEPKSITVKEWFSENKTDVPHAVSHHRPGP